jgi:hypothetical protein
VPAFFAVAYLYVSVPRVAEVWNVKLSPDPLLVRK